jgi:hypothetical protein
MRTSTSTTAAARSATNNTQGGSFTAQDRDVHQAHLDEAPELVPGPVKQQEHAGLHLRPGRRVLSQVRGEQHHGPGQIVPTAALGHAPALDRQRGRARLDAEPRRHPVELQGGGQVQRGQVENL